LDGAFQPLPVRPGFWITEIRESDLPAYLVHFRDREIHDWTLRIPFPYTVGDAREWLELTRIERDSSGRPLHYALRTEDGLLVGGLGIHMPRSPGRHHEAELGYWLAKPLWGRGIMTDAVRSLMGYAFGPLRLRRLTAVALVENLASRRVLEKNAFILEGWLRGRYEVDGRLRDAVLYARLA
jgi:RimJ/RimL family protein N-acetyltransferase